MGLDRARSKGRGLEVGEPPISALSAANEVVNRGYYAPTTLSAVDTDLATGNIKFGIIIFGIAGHTNVRDSSDADLTAPEAPTGKTFYAGGGARKTGSGTKTLSAANEIVAAGYYAATTLSTVDGDLAPANIKSGVVIFGFTGTAVPDPSIATGSYVGNDGAARQITTGFKCSCVIILHLTSADWNSLLIPSAAVTINGVALAVTALHATDGFVVDAVADNTNHSANTYYYWAISE